MEQLQKLSILVIEDDDVLRRTFKRALQDWSKNIVEANSLDAAKSALSETIPDIVILDVNLPDGSGVEFAEILSQTRPMPLTIAISGEATAQQAFLLKSFGVQAYLAKPFSFIDLQNALGELLVTPPLIEPHVSVHVGKSSFKEVHSNVRKTMLEQALAISKGNRSQAGRLLKISRQAVQQMISELSVSMDDYQ